MELTFTKIGNTYLASFISQGKDVTVLILQLMPYLIRVYANIENMDNTLIYMDTDDKKNKIFIVSVPEGIEVTIECDSLVVNASILGYESEEDNAE